MLVDGVVVISRSRKNCLFSASAMQSHFFGDVPEPLLCVPGTSVHTSLLRFESVPVST